VKIALTSVLILFSSLAFANSKPCLTQARQEVRSRAMQMFEDSDCSIKLSKINQTTEVVTYFAELSCVEAGGFFDVTDVVAMKYTKLPSGKYSCTVL
jgi:hypothetical protein